MDVAIIGAGNVGGALAAASVRAGHSVVLSSRTREKLEGVAKETGALAARSNGEAVRSGEVVVLAVPYSALDEAVSEVAEDVVGKIVVDATNRANLEDPGSVLDGTSAAEQSHRVDHVPGCRVER